MTIGAAAEKDDGKTPSHLSMETFFFSLFPLYFKILSGQQLFVQRRRKVVDNDWKDTKEGRPAVPSCFLWIIIKIKNTHLSRRTL